MDRDLELKPAYPPLMEIPKKLKRTLKKLEAEGEEPLLIFPALLERYATQ